MLRYSADRRTVGYMIVTTALLFLQWNLSSVNPFLLVLSMYMGVTVAVIAHNHNHLPMWKSGWLNVITDYWLTLFYGFPAFGWIPTHNRNHHLLNNKEGDYTITYRLSEANNLLTLVTYPTMSSYHQQKPIRDYLVQLWSTDREKFYLCFMQYVALGLFYAIGLYLDWKKTLLFIFLPHQTALFSIMIFNYVQHVHADEESDFNHSRNFTGFLNVMLFNNGFHTVHHMKAGTHWSKTPQMHAEVADKIDPALNERSFWGYIFRVYFAAPFHRAWGTRSMRLDRMKSQSSAASSL